MSECIGAAETNLRQFGPAGQPALGSIRATQGTVEGFLPESPVPGTYLKPSGSVTSYCGLVQCDEELKEHPGVSPPGPYLADAAFFFGRECVDGLLPSFA